MSTVEVVLFALAGIALWLGHSAFFPWTGCNACPGGKKRNDGGKGAVWRDCRWCGGSGKRRRVGKRLIEVLGSTGEESRR